MNFTFVFCVYKVCSCMYMCVCVCMYVKECVCVCICVCMCLLCVHACMLVRFCFFTSVCMCLLFRVCPAASPTMARMGPSRSVPSSTAWACTLAALLCGMTGSGCSIMCMATTATQVCGCQIPDATLIVFSSGSPVCVGGLAVGCVMMSPGCPSRVQRRYQS